MYGVNVTRVNRSGMDIFASRNLTLQVGDRVMVVGPQAVSYTHLHPLYRISVRLLIQEWK